MPEHSKWKSYKKEFDYSYTIGAFPTVELIQNRPEMVKEICLHSKFHDTVLFEKLCKDRIPIVTDDRIFSRLGLNENSFVLGIFEKQEKRLCENKPHIVLVNPGDMGNLGTIERTLLGFGYHDLAIITPAADPFHPKAIRASMGAFFHLNVTQFESFEQYQSQYPGHAVFPFMLGAKEKLTLENCPQSSLFSLVFGNEASGLPESFLQLGEPVQIPQSDEVDSLNLAVAAAIGSYTFAVKNHLL